MIKTPHKIAPVPNYSIAFRDSWTIFLSTRRGDAELRLNADYPEIFA